MEEGSTAAAGGEDFPATAGGPGALAAGALAVMDDDGRQLGTLKAAAALESWPATADAVAKAPRSAMTAAHIIQAPAGQDASMQGWIWLAAIAFALLCLMLRQSVDWTPHIGELDLPIPDVINAFTDWFDSIFQPFFRAISFGLDKPMRAIQAVLQWLPWPAVMLLVGVTALRAGGWKLALFAVASLAYLVIVDYWTQSMNTLALVILAVPLSVVIGFALGVLADRVPRAIPRHRGGAGHDADHARFRLSDPAAAALRFGPVVGLIASAIMPSPMVRNTLLGLSGAAGDQGSGQ
jgi:hypothetical protein